MIALVVLAYNATAASRWTDGMSSSALAELGVASCSSPFPSGQREILIHGQAASSDIRETSIRMLVERSTDVGKANLFHVWQIPHPLSRWILDKMMLHIPSSRSRESR